MKAKELVWDVIDDRGWTKYVSYTPFGRYIIDVFKRDNRICSTKRIQDGWIERKYEGKETVDELKETFQKEFEILLNKGFEDSYRILREDTWRLVTRDDTWNDVPRNTVYELDTVFGKLSISKETSVLTSNGNEEKIITDAFRPDDCVNDMQWSGFNYAPHPTLEAAKRWLFSRYCDGLVTCSEPFARLGKFNKEKKEWEWGINKQKFIDFDELDLCAMSLQTIDEDNAYACSVGNPIIEVERNLSYGILREKIEKIIFPLNEADSQTIIKALKFKKQDLSNEESNGELKGFEAHDARAICAHIDRILKRLED